MLECQDHSEATSTPPPPPTRDEAIQALDLAWSFLRRQPPGFFEPKEYLTIGRLVEKLKHLLRPDCKAVRPDGKSPRISKKKWLQVEDKKIIKLRAEKESWEKISQQLRGRSAMSCRLRYQNYLERPEWDEAKKKQLALLYDRYIAKSTSRSLNTRRDLLTTYQTQVQGRVLEESC